MTELDPELLCHELREALRYVHHHHYINAFGAPSSINQLLSMYFPDPAGGSFLMRKLSTWYLELTGLPTTFYRTYCICTYAQ